MLAFRCAGGPQSSRADGIPAQKDRVTIIYQRDHQAREIFLGRTHPAKLPLSWYGDSVGYYEGDNTLVVGTIGQVAKPMSVVDPFGTPYTDKIHVVERYRLIHDECGRGLEVVFTVDDPGAFTTPWKGHGNLSPQSRTV